MTPLGAYWWSPLHSSRSLANELITHGQGWMRLLSKGGHRPTNFGDEITPHVLQLATGRRIKWRTEDDADVFAVGSVIERRLQAKSRAMIWGSGLRGATGNDVCAPETAGVRFLAVRGPRTREALGLPHSTPLGDPGLLMGQIGRPSKRRGTILIPHFKTFATDHGRHALRIARAAGIRVVVPNEDPIDVLHLIRSADLVLTSSLHGLVLADATASRAHLVHTLPSTMREPEFKFMDYGESVECVPTASAIEDLLGEGGRGAAMEFADFRIAATEGPINRLIDGLFTAAQALDNY